MQLTDLFLFACVKVTILLQQHLVFPLKQLHALAGALYNKRQTIVDTAKTSTSLAVKSGLLLMTSAGMRNSSVKQLNAATTNKRRRCFSSVVNCSMKRYTPYKLPIPQMK